MVHSIRRTVQVSGVVLMTSGIAIDLGREAFMQAFWLAMPVLGVALVTGLVLGMFQTMTQIQEQTVSLVPRLLVTLITLVLLLPWMMNRLTDFLRTVLIGIV
ncbi:MAG: flagellar biosynthetic protein FliQ [Planctomycetia bacterium]|nr:flagellar biosynthetic protein FliQ [Planctomycetia bacterium]